MTQIGKTIAQFMKAQPQPEKPDKETAAKKAEGAAVDKTSLATVKADFEARLVEFLLAVRKEAKKEFTTQSTTQERAADQEPQISEVQFDGKSITELTPEEAADLISEDGYFGVKKTAQRLADFVIKGSGDDLQRLQAGREGLLRGFGEAEEVWGGAGTLPDISYQTRDKALELIDARIQELGGGSMVDVQA